MLMWTVDLGSAAVLTALEVAALAAFWFAEGLKQWAAGGARPPGATARLFLVLTVGPTGLVAVSYGFYRADLPVACGSQALLAAALVLLLALGEERSAPACLPSTPQGVVRSASAFAGEGIGAPTLAYDLAGAACCTTSKDHRVDPLAAGFGRSPPPDAPPSSGPPSTP